MQRPGAEKDSPGRRARCGVARGRLPQARVPRRDGVLGWGEETLGCSRAGEGDSRLIHEGTGGASAQSVRSAKAAAVGEAAALRPCFFLA